MNHKYLLSAAIAAALLLGAQAASACAISAWDATSTVLAADAAEPASGNNNPTVGGFTRYAGKCGLKATGVNKFVRDQTPNGETSYRVRFYFYTGNITGSTEVFRARNNADAMVMNVTFNGDTNVVTVAANGTASTDTMTVVDNAWYSVELDWAQGTGVTGRIRGNGAIPCATPACPNNEQISVAAVSALTIDDIKLGIIATSGVTVTAPLFFDEFDSRRTQSPGRLRRGDANNSGTVNATDATVILNEFSSGGPNQAPGANVGTPDCNESGRVNATDASCALNIFANPANG